MTGIIGGLVMMLLGVGMVVLGKPVRGVERAFVRSWPLLILYVTSCMALIIFGLAWLIQAVAATAWA
jgi:hypothetical protein